MSLIAIISIPNLSFKTATDGSTLVCTQQQLSDFRSEFSKKWTGTPFRFLKKEPERRSGAFWSNSNPVLNDCLQHLSSLILTIITSLLLYVELTTDVKYDVSEIIEQRWRVISATRRRCPYSGDDIVVTRSSYFSESGYSWFVNWRHETSWRISEDYLRTYLRINCWKK